MTIMVMESQDGCHYDKRQQYDICSVLYNRVYHFLRLRVVVEPVTLFTTSRPIERPMDVRIGIAIEATAAQKPLFLRFFAGAAAEDDVLDLVD